MYTTSKVSQLAICCKQFTMCAIIVSIHWGSYVYSLHALNFLATCPVCWLCPWYQRHKMHLCSFGSSIKQVNWSNSPNSFIITLTTSISITALWIYDDHGTALPPPVRMHNLCWLQAINVIIYAAGHCWDHLDTKMHHTALTTFASCSWWQLKICTKCFSIFNLSFHGIPIYFPFCQYYTKWSVVHSNGI